MPSWEYLFVNVCLVPAPGGGEWHPRLVNNQPLPNWELGPTLDSFIKQLEAQGWQLARRHPNTSLDQAITFTLLFKRPRWQEPLDLASGDVEQPPSTLE